MATIHTSMCGICICKSGPGSIYLSDDPGASSEGSSGRKIGGGIDVNAGMAGFGMFY